MKEAAVRQKQKQNNSYYNVATYKSINVFLAMEECHCIDEGPGPGKNSK